MTRRPRRLRGHRRAGACAAWPSFLAPAAAACKCLRPHQHLSLGSLSAGRCDAAVWFSSCTLCAESAWRRRLPCMRGKRVFLRVCCMCAM